MQGGTVTNVNNENKKGLVVGLVGLIGSGKDTAADYLCNSHGFRRDSFANTLKDAVSVVFGWDRTLLEGRTAESRAWREEVDTWWSDRLDIPNLTPRWVLQYWGTDVCRNNFHDDIWIASLENKIRKTKDNIVISDVRFTNEIRAIKNSGGIVVRIKRGEDPEWFKYALDYNAGPSRIGWALGKDRLIKLGIHASEYSWVGGDIDYEVSNDGTIDDLYDQIKNLLPNQLTTEIKLILDIL
jgi:hypothetical protein